MTKEQRRGSTPHGGDYSEAVYLDDDGRIVDKSVATRANIRELKDDGTLVGETFMYMQGARQSGRNDADDQQWITINGTHVPVGEGGELKGAVGSKVKSEARQAKGEKPAPPSRQEYSELRRYASSQFGGYNDHAALLRGSDEKLSQALERAKAAAQTSKFPSERQTMQVAVDQIEMELRRRELENSGMSRFEASDVVTEEFKSGKYRTPLPVGGEEPITAAGIPPAPGKGAKASKKLEKAPPPDVPMDASDAESLQYGKKLSSELKVRGDYSYSDEDIHDFVSSRPEVKARYSQMNDVQREFFERGILGEPDPQPIVGWRYGKFEENGQSYNFKENRREPGVSLAQAKSSDTYYSAVNPMTLLSYEDKPIYWATGYLSRHKGSDGEPLVLRSKEIPDPAKKKA